jgi:hypothetical protein
MDELSTLGSLGLSLPTPAYLFGIILFSVIGYAAYRYGKKTSLITTKWLGVALMFYPYVIYETWQLYVVGAGLCAGLFVWRR